MRSELFEETLKQHKDSLTDELVKLGKHRQVQLVEWDIERNETDYEFYFDGAWNAQQSKIDELQKRVDAAKYYMKNIFSGDAEVDQCHLGDLLDILDGKIVDELEQALKGGSDESN